MKSALIFTAICLFVPFLVAEEIYASFDVAPQKSSRLAMQQIGIVSEVKVEIGDIVKKGDTLVLLSNEDELIMLEDSQISLQMANLAKNHAQSLLKRFQAAASVTSKQEFDNVKFSFDSASNQLQKAKVGIKNAQNLINKKILLAPYDGIIVAKSVEVGDGVGGVAQSLLVINSLESKLVLSFDEKYKNLVKVGDKFTYKIDGDDANKTGEISLIYPYVDRSSRKIFAEVKAGTVMSGVFGEGYIRVK